MNIHNTSYSLGQHASYELQTICCLQVLYNPDHDTSGWTISLCQGSTRRWRSRWWRSNKATAFLRENYSHPSNSAGALRPARDAVCRVCCVDAVCVCAGAGAWGGVNHGLYGCVRIISCSISRGCVLFCSHKSFKISRSNVLLQFGG